MRVRAASRAAIYAAVVLPLSVLFAPLSHAADADGRFAVKSVGGSTCSQFVEVLKAKDQSRIALYVGWIAGYVSASNQLEPGTFDLAAWQDMRTLTALLTRHCDRNADLRFGAAAAQMINALKNDRLVKGSEIVKIDREGQPLQLYQEALRRGQAALAELGMFSGDLNGEFDDATRQALTKFQEQNKLTVSGLPDQQTLFALFRAVHKAPQ